MNYFYKIQKAIDFIEYNLQTNISLDDISKEAFSSLSHFHRIFAYMTGLSVKKYINKRRLSQAAKDLITSNKKIIDLAFDYQYKTHETFTRAFKTMFGENPKNFRKITKEHKLFEKINIYDEKYKDLYNDESIKIDIVVYNNLKVIGYELKTTMINNQNALDIPNFWSNIHDNNKLDNIPNSLENDKIFGVYTNLDYENNFTLLGCKEVQSLDSIPDGMVGKIIPAAKFAVFTTEGKMPEKLVNTWHYIYANWFPKTRYERDKSDDFEVYDKNFFFNPDYGKLKIYIPVKFD